jgi:methionyl-tRNA synthetase
MVMQSYCENDRKYLPDRYVIGSCPFCRAENQYSDGCENCGRTFQPGEIKDPKCSICGNIPVKNQSKHYFFKLSNFSEKLRIWLTQNNNLQEDVKNYVLHWIQEGLKDWDITRDIQWGVPVPLQENTGKVFYGWFDNHLCYISSTLSYFQKKGINGKDFWNSAEIFHFIGKDIVYHHYLFLPAIRIGIDEEYKLPDFIPTRGHLMLEGEKFSKSRGWYIGLREYLDNFSADYLRYYLSTITPFNQSDVNFDWDDFLAKINNELVANIGNFIYRAMNFISNRCNGVVPFPEDYDEIDNIFKKEILLIKTKVETHLESNEFDKAIRKIIDFSSACNRYFQKKEPWRGSNGTKTCLYLSINAVKSLAVLLEPYIGSSIKELWKQLNLNKPLIWSTASKIDIEPGHKINKPTILFKKLEEKEILKQKNKLKD